MNTLSIGGLVLMLVILLLLSAFFSASETAMMALNRYRLSHLASEGHHGARLARALLERPDRLLSTILLGNNFANIAAASVATVIALRLYGETAIAVASLLLTLLVLIVAEIAPKTLAALHPEFIAYPAAYVLTILQKIFLPIVHLINMMGNGLLRIFGVSLQRRQFDLSTEELRTVLKTSATQLPQSRREMLLSILDLEHITVDDIMVPRQQIEAIDLDDDFDEVIEQLVTAHHSRLPLYQESMDRIVGILHLRQILYLMQREDFCKQHLLEVASPPYFIPEGTPLSKQLVEMQKYRRTTGLVVNEYGDLQGLVGLEEILEEIVGEFTRSVPGMDEEIEREADGSLVVDGRIHVRELNRKYALHLPTDGPKTVNGLILEAFEAIPDPGTTLLIADYPLEVVQTRGTSVTVVRINPRRNRSPQ
ncbi:MAG TPA: HlyC/CorC family transporter [Gammaproteobacteria bacterium]|nr:HlyC/CorC family transporter [Gammaproteobacteria bacterium]